MMGIAAFYWKKMWVSSMGVDHCEGFVFVLLYDVVSALAGIILYEISPI
jgi:hypothetical protein